MPQALRTFHCPRWQELPGLELYLDQVMLVLEQILAPLAAGQERGVITPTIINNYVKQHLLPPTSRKKYSRAHLSLLIELLLLKRVLSAAEMAQVLQALGQGRTPQQAHDLFACALEHCLGTGEPLPAELPPLALAALQALVGRLAFEQQLALAAAPAAQAAALPPAAPQEKKKKQPAQPSDPQEGKKKKQPAADTPDGAPAAKPEPKKKRQHHAAQPQPHSEEAQQP